MQIVLSTTRLTYSSRLSTAGTTQFSRAFGNHPKPLGSYQILPVAARKPKMTIYAHAVDTTPARALRSIRLARKSIKSGFATIRVRTITIKTNTVTIDIIALHNLPYRYVNSARTHQTIVDSIVPSVYLSSIFLNRNGPVIVILSLSDDGLMTSYHSANPVTGPDGTGVHHYDAVSIFQVRLGYGPLYTFGATVTAAALEVFPVPLPVGDVVVFQRSSFAFAVQRQIPSR